MTDENEARSDELDAVPAVETEKSSLKKVVEPIERKGGYSGADFADLTAPDDKPGLVEPEQSATPEPGGSTDVEEPRN